MEADGGPDTGHDREGGGKDQVRPAETQPRAKGMASATASSGMAENAYTAICGAIPRRSLMIGCGPGRATGPAVAGAADC